MRENVPLDSIVLSDPAVLADVKSKTYYMTGTGGQLWKSADLELWTGPYNVAQTDPDSWMGPNPMIWAAELHEYNGKYYYFATFTNRDVITGEYRGNKYERRASHVLVSDTPEGPYRPMADPTYLPADRPTLDGTFWVDNDGKPYMVYCGEWLSNWNGTMEKIQLKEDLSGSVGREPCFSVLSIHHGAMNLWMGRNCQVKSPTAPGCSALAQDVSECYGQAGYMMSTRREWLILNQALLTDPGCRRRTRSHLQTTGMECFSKHSMANGFSLPIAIRTSTATIIVCPVSSL